MKTPERGAAVDRLVQGVLALAPSDATALETYLGRSRAAYVFDGGRSGVAAFA